jgi:predicted metal-binding membrane protein
MNSSGTQTASRTKLFAAIIGGSAMVAMGTLTLAMHQEQTIGGSNGVYLSTGGGQMTLGGEVTTTTGVATALATEKAVPAVKATPFK